MGGYALIVREDWASSGLLRSHELGCYARCMKITRLLAVVVTLTIPVSAWAGDPCPIGFEAMNLGIPPWAKPELKKQVANGDTLFDKLINIASKLDCSRIEKISAVHGSLPVKFYEPVTPEQLKVSAIRKKLFGNGRRFRCADAHKALKHLGATTNSSGMVLFFRGHKRILFAVPGWSTTCVSAAKADRMSDKQLRSLWKRITQKRVDDRHENP